MDRPMIGDILRQQAQLLAALKEQLDTLTDGKTDEAVMPEARDRIPPMDLFAREEMRVVAHAIAELGTRQIDTVLVDNGWHRMERIIADISDCQRNQYVITEKQVDILFDRLNKAKYESVAPMIRAITPEVKAKVESRMRAYTNFRQKAMEHQAA